MSLELEIARRRCAEGELAVQQQKQEIAKLEQLGLPLMGARTLLRLHEQTLEQCMEALDRLLNRRP